MLALVLGAFAVIQLASDSLYAAVAARGSFPSHIAPQFGVRVYELLDRIAPAPYVESTLARVALQRGDTVAAEQYAVRLPPTPVRNGLLETIAAARGQGMLAYEYAFAAPDIAGVQAQIARVRLRNPRAAYAMEAQFRDRLIALRTHPDAVARAWWTLGTIASQIGDPASLQLAYRDYVTAAQLAPFDLTNLLGAANQALTLHQWTLAQMWYRRALAVNPGAADPIAGLGIVALNTRHDRPMAQRQLQLAHAIDARAGLVLELQRELERAR